MSRRIAILAVLVACRGDIPATEIIVTVDTIFGVPCTIDALRVEATGDGDPVTTEDIPVDDAALPGSVTLVPRGNPREVTVTVTGLREGTAFATARGTARFEDDSSLELRFVLDRSCVPGPCPAAGVGGFTELPERQARRGCGARNYSWKHAFFVMRDACAMPDATMRTVLTDVDEAEAMSPLTPMPFPFRFYGAPVTRVWAGTNGYIGFGDTMPNALTGSVGESRPLGEPGFPGKGVLAFWDNLRTSPLGVCFTTTGELPDRILWITWKEACFADPTRACAATAPDLGTLTFGIALEETTDRIYIGYGTMAATMGNVDRAKAQNATIGVTNSVARGCKTEQCSANGMCENGTPCGFTEFPARKIVNPLPTLEFDPQ